MNVAGLVDRPSKYLFSDGVAELLLGCFLLFYSTSIAELSRLGPNWAWGWGGFSGPLLLGVAAFGMKWSIGFLRTRVIAPRGGHVVIYVRPYQRVLFLCFFFVLALTLELAEASHVSKATGISALFFAIYLLSAAIYRLPYMFVLAALSGALCLWVTREGGDLVFVMQCVGLMNAVAGGVKLWRFVRSHPIAIDIEA